VSTVNPGGRSRQHLNREFVGLEFASAYTDYCKATLRAKINSGELPAYRISDKPGSIIKVKISDLDKLFKPVIPEAITASRGGVA
jgi:hypothetical protein